MPELIDRDAALKLAYHNYYPSIDHLCCSVKCATYDELEALPTIEAEPVRHGEWHECWYTDTVCASICTNCGKAATQARHIVGQELMTNVRYPLCPNCGAKMDGGSDNG